jgi:hypothetical protein
MLVTIEKECKEAIFLQITNNKVKWKEIICFQISSLLNSLNFKVVVFAII